MLKGFKGVIRISLYVPEQINLVRFGRINECHRILLEIKNQNEKASQYKLKGF